MEEEKSAIMYQVHPDLLVPPHVAKQLIEWVAGEVQPNIAQMEQIAIHLTECTYCRTKLIVLLSTAQRYDRLNEPVEPTIQDLLTRVEGVHGEIEALGNEQIAAYAETIVAKGRVEADKHFSVLAEHISRCQSCKAMLEAMLEFLHENDETN